MILCIVWFNHLCTLLTFKQKYEVDFSLYVQILSSTACTKSLNEPVSLQAISLFLYVSLTNAVVFILQVAVHLTESLNRDIWKVL